MGWCRSARQSFGRANAGLRGATMRETYEWPGHAYARCFRFRVFPSRVWWVLSVYQVVRMGRCLYTRLAYWWMGGCHLGRAMRGHGRPGQLTCFRCYYRNLLRSGEASDRFLKLSQIRCCQLWAKNQASTQHPFLRTSDRSILAIYFEYCRYDRGNGLRRYPSR